MEVYIKMVKPSKKKNESIDSYNERASKLYYHNGYCITEIAKKLDIGEIEVYNYVTTGKKITTEEERQEMIRLYNKGYSYTAIAKMLNKSRSCVRNRIERPAKAKWHNSVNFSDRQLKKMKDMCKDGAYMETISKEFGVKTSSIRYRLEHMGRSKHHTRVSQEEKELFIYLYKQGKTHEEIAEICNRNRHTVYTHLHRAGYWRSKEK